jgi:hypothetical protein
MICTTYFLTFFSELIPPTGVLYLQHKSSLNPYQYEKESIKENPVC